MTAVVLPEKMSICVPVDAMNLFTNVFRFATMSGSLQTAAFATLGPPW